MGEKGVHFSYPLTPVALDRPISPALQATRIFDHSEVFFQAIRGVGDQAGGVTAILDAWAGYVRGHRERFPEHGVLRFIVRDPERLAAEDRKVLDCAVQHSFVQRVQTRKGVGPSGIVRDNLRPHRLLCPRYGLSLDDHQLRVLTAADVRAAISEPSEFSKRMLGRRVARGQNLVPTSIDEIPADERS